MLAAAIMTMVFVTAAAAAPSTAELSGQEGMAPAAVRR